MSSILTVIYVQKQLKLYHNLSSRQFLWKKIKIKKNITVALPPHPWGICSKTPQWMLETTDSMELCVYCAFFYTYIPSYLNRATYSLCNIQVASTTTLALWYIIK